MNFLKLRFGNKKLIRIIKEVNIFWISLFSSLRLGFFIISVLEIGISTPSLSGPFENNRMLDLVFILSYSGWDLCNVSWILVWNFCLIFIGSFCWIVGLEQQVTTTNQTSWPIRWFLNIVHSSSASWRACLTSWKMIFWSESPV